VTPLSSGQGSPTGYRSAEDEPCSLKIQYMLVEAYVDYLNIIGFKMLDVRYVTPSKKLAPKYFGFHKLFLTLLQRT
jgi:hypothetical protein